MDVKILVIVGLLISQIGSGYFFYDYWYDHEYPNGEKNIWTDKIELWENSFDRTNFITIGSNTYEIKDFDVKSVLFDELDGWKEMNYTIEDNNDIYFPGIIINITNNREYSFRINYHTYDAMVNGNDLSFIKQKVIDSLDVDASCYPKS